MGSVGVVSVGHEIGGDAAALRVDDNHAGLRNLDGKMMPRVQNDGLEGDVQTDGNVDRGGLRHDRTLGPSPLNPPPSPSGHLASYQRKAPRQLSWR
jgi:hypothetical protein